MEKDTKDTATQNGMDAAFTRPYTDYNSSEFGLTKREYFAGLALQGILANHQLLLNLDNVDGGAEAFAVRSADALLLELAK